MTRVYLDACTIIYLVEAVEPFHAHAVFELAPLKEDSEARFITSRLSVLECRVVPMRDGNRDLLSAYDEFFSANELLVARSVPGSLKRRRVFAPHWGFGPPTPST